MRRLALRTTLSNETLKRTSPSFMEAIRINRLAERFSLSIVVLASGRSPLSSALGSECRVCPGFRLADAAGYAL